MPATRPRSTPCVCSPRSAVRSARFHDEAWLARRALALDEHGAGFGPGWLPPGRTATVPEPGRARAVGNWLAVRLVWAGHGGSGRLFGHARGPLRQTRISDLW